MDEKPSITRVTLPIDGMAAEMWDPCAVVNLHGKHPLVHFFDSSGKLVAVKQYENTTEAAAALALAREGPKCDGAKHITTHEFAKQLLDGPDRRIVVCSDDEHYHDPIVMVTFLFPV